jgi:hypothetical protein
MKMFDSIFISSEQAERAFHQMVDKVAYARHVRFYSLKDMGASRDSFDITVEPWGGDDNDKTVCMVTCFKWIWWGKPKCEMSFHFDSNVMRVSITYEEFQTFYSRAVLLKTTKAHGELISAIGDYNKIPKTINI